MEDIIGYLAAVLGTVCWLPQAIKTWRTKATADLSLWANLLILATILLWLGYGVLLMAWPLIVANIISSALVSSIILAKLIYK